jgi:hypothetical protein
MKSEILVALILASLLCGCPSLGGAPAGQRVKVQPVTILSESGETPPAGAAASEGPPPALMEQLKLQEEAIASSKAEGNAAASPAKPQTAPAAAAPQAAPASLPQAAPSAPAGQELTTEYLVTELESKKERTPAEDQAYKRLLGVAPAQEPPSENADAYRLLTKARDAVLKGDFESARSDASEALILIRDKTNPVIDRVYFATEVRSYGNGDVVPVANFRAGQRVLLVTDLSNFTCRPVGVSSPATYQSKLDQRLAIYDAGGKLIWQRSYDAFEYQSTQYTDTMFIPLFLALPANIKNGQYTMKVSVTDHLSGRQVEAGTTFGIV